jgi:hypothetical protein
MLLVVVLVVVDAMEMTTNRIGDVDTVLRYAESNPEDVATLYNVSDLDLEPSTEYLVELFGRTRNKNTLITKFRANTGKRAREITIPKDVIVQNEEAKPGQSVRFRIYDIVRDGELGLTENNKKLMSSDECLTDISTAARGKASDGCYSRLASAKIADFIGDGGEELVLFKNLRNGETSQYYAGASAADIDSKNVEFPISLRRRINAEPGDQIFLAVGDIEEMADSDDSSTDDTQKRVADDQIKQLIEKVDEIHNVIMEYADDS